MVCVNKNIDIDNSNHDFNNRNPNTHDEEHVWDTSQGDETDGAASVKTSEASHTDMKVTMEPRKKQGNVTRNEHSCLDKTDEDEFGSPKCLPINQSTN